MKLLLFKAATFARNLQPLSLRLQPSNLTSPPRSRIRSVNFSTQPISSPKWPMYFSPSLVKPCALKIIPCCLCTIAPRHSVLCRPAPYLNSLSFPRGSSGHWPHRCRLYQSDATDGSLLPVANLPTEHHPDSRPPPLRRHPLVQQVLLTPERYEPEGISEGGNTPRIVA